MLGTMRLQKTSAPAPISPLKTSAKDTGGARALSINGYLQSKIRKPLSVLIPKKQVINNAQHTSPTNHSHSSLSTPVTANTWTSSAGTCCSPASSIAKLQSPTQSSFSEHQKLVNNKVNLKPLHASQKFEKNLKKKEIIQVDLFSTENAAQMDQLREDARVAAAYCDLYDKTTASQTASKQTRDIHTSSNKLQNNAEKTCITSIKSKKNYETDIHSSSIRFTLIKAENAGPLTYKNIEIFKKIHSFKHKKEGPINKKIISFLNSPIGNNSFFHEIYSKYKSAKNNYQKKECVTFYTQRINNFLHEEGIEPLTIKEEKILTNALYETNLAPLTVNEMLKNILRKRVHTSITSEYLMEKEKEPLPAIPKNIHGGMSLTEYYAELFSDTGLNSEKNTIQHKIQQAKILAKLPGNFIGKATSQIKTQIEKTETWKKEISKKFMKNISSTEESKTSVEVKKLKFNEVLKEILEIDKEQYKDIHEKFKTYKNSDAKKHPEIENQKTTLQFVMMRNGKTVPFWTFPENAKTNMEDSLRQLKEFFNNEIASSASDVIIFSEIFDNVNLTKKGISEGLEKFKERVNSIQEKKNKIQETLEKENKGLDENIKNLLKIVYKIDSTAPSIRTGLEHFKNEVYLYPSSFISDDLKKNGGNEHQRLSLPEFRPEKLNIQINRHSY